MKTKIFVDGAHINEIAEMCDKSFVKGFTTNPTLMRKAGVENYEEFAKSVLNIISDKPISFEVFSDDFSEMVEQAIKIQSWGKNIYVKIPVTNTKGDFTGSVIEKLVKLNIKVNITAVMTTEQVLEISKVLNPEVPSCVSIFAGRIADTGRDPLPIIKDSLKKLNSLKKNEVIWASPRELLNLIQAEEVGCHIITVTNEILKKIDLLGYSLEDYSLDTVKMFFNDAKSSGFSI
jgi:transaldolase